VLSALGLLSGLACAGSEGAAPRTLQVVRIDPERSEGVFLNEPLAFHFSAEVDPLSVSRESVVIETADGQRARGSLSVEGRKVLFQPDVPHAPDLSDGGYRPGASYRVRLVGFPSPDGLRGAEGEPLAFTRPWSFTTVAADQPRRSALFDDPHQEYRKPPDLYPGGSAMYTIGAGDALYIACEKQIDPTSVRAIDFKLEPERLTAGAPPSEFALYARLVENEPVARRERPRGVHTQSSDEAWRAERRAALIELTPVQPLEPGTYRLRYQPAGAPAGEEVWSLRDFSRRPLLPDLHLFHLFSRKIQVFAGSGSDSHGESFVEDFVDHDMRSPLRVPDCDGTAAWEGNGRVEVHYPLAAGDGSADAVSLSAEEARTDLQATSIELAAGQTCRLPDGPGLVVLRAQGRILLRGVLERRATLAQAFDCGPPGTQLSDWLARARAANPSWTVLIAGGDLVIEGEIRSAVPVLLVAGGQVRNLGPALPAELCWTQSGASGPRSPHDKPDACFVLDPPVKSNPLRAPLRYAVVSGPVPSTGVVGRWSSAQASGGLEPARGRPETGRTPSSFSVHYFSADAPQLPDFSKAPTNPAFLPQPGPVRFVVELVVGDEQEWQAPFVDRVQLEFEKPR
jgi:hypothetical protein